MSIRTRIKLLEAVGQATTTTPAPNTTAGPTTVVGSPSAFDPYSFFPTMTLGWGSANVNWIKKICFTINNAIYLLSNGQLDLNKLRAANFIVDTSKYPDATLTAVVRFSTQLYKFMLTNQGVAFKSALTPEIKSDLVDKLKNYLVYFQVPDGSINSALVSKIGGNFKQVLIDTLTQIK